MAYLIVHCRIMRLLIVYIVDLQLAQQPAPCFFSQFLFFACFVFIFVSHRWTNFKRIFYFIAFRRFLWFDSNTKQMWNHKFLITVISWRYTYSFRSMSLACDKHAHAHSSSRRKNNNLLFFSPFLMRTKKKKYFCRLR